MFILMLSRRLAVLKLSIITLALAATGSGFAQSDRNAAAESAPALTANSNNRLFELIDAADYSQDDKEALKKGLSVALPSATSDYVSQETVDIQIKNSKNTFRVANALITSVTKGLDQKTTDFFNSEDFQKIDVADRDKVRVYLGQIVEQYRARACETLLNHFERQLSVPDDVPRSITNADYRTLLYLAVETALAHTPPALGDTRYVLQNGDSLALLARVYKVRTTEILAANPNLKPMDLRPGKKIVIPPPRAN